MTYKTIRVEELYEGEVTEITLNTPPANILSAKMMAEIKTQLEIEQSKPHKKLIIFGGEGKHFCFGASVEEHQSGQVDDMLPGFHDLIGKLVNCKIPTLAKVTGMSLGGGFEFVLACTFVFADESAKFGVPEITLGVFPPVAAALLPFKCSDHFSSQMILTGDTFPVKELDRHGLINQVTEKGKLDEVVQSFFVEKIQPKSASSLRIACQASSMLMSDKYKEVIGRLESLYLKDLMSTKDAVEGINAFLEKRKPVWQDA
ncbi:enoyl-CoA hydratase/isomerase family protein [bacterium]|nr:enoyl-CoA hydratase/isomerase family protein [bacterium]